MNLSFNQANMDPRSEAMATYFDKAAAKLDPRIQKALNPACAQQNPTPRRSRQVTSSIDRGVKLQKKQVFLSSIATMYRQQDSRVDPVETVSHVNALIALGEHKNIDLLTEKQQDDLNDMGIFDAERASQLFAIVDAFGADDPKMTAALQHQTQKAGKQKLRNLAGQIPGYFPSPDAVIQELMNHANINPQNPGRIIDPFAGDGAIVRYVNQQLGIAHTEACEINHDLREHLDRQGITVTSNDAYDLTAGDQYQTIITNPPFEKKQSLRGVKHLFENHLLPGGTIVSVMEAGAMSNSSKEHLDFQEWVEDHDGYHVDLPENSFKESGTGVNTIILSITK